MPGLAVLSEGWGPSSSGEASAHYGIHCDGCRTNPIVGVRYKCSTCDDFDYCSSCMIMFRGAHNPHHVFKSIEAPGSMDGFGRSTSLRSSETTCDGCSRRIVGPFHKCLDCPSFSYCGPCANSSQKRKLHNPQHSFFPVQSRMDMSTFLGVQAARRRVEHFGVTCDGCRQRIHGVRHKCLHCTDFDFCDKCLSNSVVREQHGFHHQFYPVDSPGDLTGYDRVRSTLPHTPAANVHRAFCDGCENRIVGTRHKCLVCRDFDFCDACVANPALRTLHDVTHALFPIVAASDTEAYDSARRRSGGDPVHAYDAPPPYIPPTPVENP
ncbi:uncharacterized protein PHACADRAFT_262870 [Phanerochaete carnosa HHB-10118-sp]|uniref:ZZ-type domain-containing protein n=1 Tax=Phanerochaete carnosa (strain HHB-10118-sp) TaxID=650164 RepID=K5WL15_PHACS|nr:uncharacterized protein PHACADRAFT_262870 [Phanerochaete carnosa HHB-10118-sp]EKM50962.1 hypothetical protein PHACADRAFT_262870 [Phanerochaete carnosa HHB-10118-sp]